jgi:transposase-like protein
MKELCKHCGSLDRVKNGYAQGKQRYKRKTCSKTYRQDDKRERYTNKQRLGVISSTYSLVLIGSEVKLLTLK